MRQTGCSRPPARFMSIPIRNQSRGFCASGRPAGRREWSSIRCTLKPALGAHLRCCGITTSRSNIRIETKSSFPSSFQNRFPKLLRSPRFPVVRNKNIDHARRTIKQTKLSVGSTVIEDATLARKLKLDGDDHYFIKHDKRTRYPRNCAGYRTNVNERLWIVRLRVFQSRIVDEAATARWYGRNTD